MILCPVCRSGRLHRRVMAYLQWHGRALLFVERMPALVCETCGEVHYDNDAIDNLQRLLWAVPLQKSDQPQPGPV